MKILYAGNYGSFSWKAAEMATRLNPRLSYAELLPSLDPPSTIRRLWAGEADMAVIPVFNHNLGGGIPSTLEGFEAVGFEVPGPSDRWLEELIALLGERVIGAPIPLPIEFAIHALPSVEAAHITRLAAYSMAIEQCHQGIARMVGRKLEIVPYSDTAKGAHDLQKMGVSLNYCAEDPEAEILMPLDETGVLGPVWCEELFGLKTVYNEVQDNPQGNVTTFLVIAKPQS